MASALPPGPHRVVVVGILVACCCIVLAVAWWSLPARPCPGKRPYDLVLTNGIVVDGFGGPGRRGEVAICGDRIAAVGRLAGIAAHKIDVHGQIIAPGFIDALGQSENSIFVHPNAESKVTQGVTSEITGEVDSVWPSAKRKVDGPYWASLDDYARDLERKGTAINIGTLIAAGSLRSAVMPNPHLSPSPAEVAEMVDLVSDGMTHGAFGLAAGLLYPPSNLFSEADLTHLATRAAAYGGVYAVHLRSESDSVIEATEEALRIGALSGAPVHIHHLKVAGKPNWPVNVLLLARLASARQAGRRISADMYPYDASSTSLMTVLPGWARAGTRADIQRRLRQTATRHRIITDLQHRQFRPSAVRLLRTSAPLFAGLTGLSLEQIGDSLHRAPLAALLDVLEADPDGAAGLIFGMDSANVDSIAMRPWISVGTDAGAMSKAAGVFMHPRTFGAFAKFYSRYVRDLHLLTLEQAVKRMALVPAQQFGVSSRGCLTPGAFADVVVFDSSHFVDRATYARPWLLSEGITNVIVNGQLVIRAGQATGARPGRFLRSGWWDAIHNSLRQSQILNSLPICGRVPSPIYSP
jgi:N-acyl-D-amino-acid deacylase